MAQTIEELLSVEKRATVHVVRFESEAVFDAKDVELVEQQLKTMIEAEQQPRLALDMEQLEQVSSVMLSLLIEARSMIQDRSGRIAVAAMNPRLKDLFEIVRIDMLFETYASVESAVVALLD